MNVTLKRKYTTFREPDNRIGKPRFKNVTMRGYGGDKSNSGKKRSKGEQHPIGYSARTIGSLIRNFRTEKKR